MRACVVDATGGDRDLVMRTLPQPVPESGEVLVRVEATALDRVDTFIRRGTHGMSSEHDVVPGRDLAGTVVEVGSGVTAFAAGDRVVAVGRGAHAELAVAPADLTFPVPEGWSFVDAAAIPTAGRTAFDALVNKAGVLAGQTVLVTAAGGGVGSMAVQLARAAGASVVATVGSDWKRDRALALGADHVVLHGGGRDWARDLGAAVGSVDAVIETVGASMWSGACNVLADNGTIVCCGVSAGHRFDAHLGRLMVRGWRWLGIGRPDRASVSNHIRQTFDAYARADLRPVIDRVLPLHRANEAHEALEQSAFFGRIVLEPVNKRETAS